MKVIHFMLDFYIDECELAQNMELKEYIPLTSIEM